MSKKKRVSFKNKGIFSIASRIQLKSGKVFEDTNQNAIRSVIYSQLGITPSKRFGKNKPKSKSRVVPKTKVDVANFIDEMKNDRVVRYH